MKALFIATVTAYTLATAHARIHEYSVVCTGPKEFPAVVSGGIGVGTVIYDDVAHTLQLQLTFSNLTGTVSQTHIHAPTTAPFFQNSGIAVGNPSLPNFPLGVTSGVYSNTLDLQSTATYSPGFLTAGGGTAAGAEAALAAALTANRAYWNIHTSAFQGGEIRDFPAPVLRIVNLQVGSDLKITSSLASTNNRSIVPEYTTNLTDISWNALSVLSNSFLNGTNEVVCGIPPVDAAYIRIRAPLN